MVWVKITSEMEAIVEVDLPFDADEPALREAALSKLDESGGAEWKGVGGWAYALNEGSV